MNQRELWNRENSHYDYRPGKWFHSTPILSYLACLLLLDWIKLLSEGLQLKSQKFCNTIPLHCEKFLQNGLLLSLRYSTKQNTLQTGMMILNYLCYYSILWQSQNQLICRNELVPEQKWIFGTLLWKFKLISTDISEQPAPWQPFNFSLCSAN